VAKQCLTKAFRYSSMSIELVVNVIICYVTFGQNEFWKRLFPRDTEALHDEQMR